MRGRENSGLNFIFAAQLALHFMEQMLGLFLEALERPWVMVVQHPLNQEPRQLPVRALAAFWLVLHAAFAAAPGALGAVVTTEIDRAESWLVSTGALSVS